MAYRLEVGEPLAQGLRRALVHELDNATTELTDVDPGRFDEAVHEARRSLKKSRTVLRLLRGGLGRDRYRAANGCLREAGRVLSATRDAAVLVEALDDLAATGLMARTAVSALRARLVAELAETHGAIAEGADPRTQALERIAAGRVDVTSWDLDARDPGDVVPTGLRRVYARGRGRMADADGTPTVEALHEWRKRVKDLGYALRLFVPAWPGLLNPLAGECRRLWDLLGDDHDLAVLDAAAAARSDALAWPADHAAFRGVVARRRAVLQKEAFAVGRRLYVERPKRFADRIGGCVAVWGDR